MKSKHSTRGTTKEVTYEVDENGCWNCTSHKCNKDGYPRIRRDYHKTGVSRFMYKKFKGEIPIGMVIRHTCDNRKCINPEHLIIGTHQENMDDRNKRHRTALGEKNGRNKITKSQVIDILKDMETPVAKLAERYNLKRGTIYDIKNRKIWAWVKM
ncbi:MAG: HNH endonuclease signature motif containing protein [Patescibacteria group bacterium]